MKEIEREREKDQMSTHKYLLYDLVVPLQLLAQCLQKHVFSSSAVAALYGCIGLERFFYSPKQCLSRLLAEIILDHKIEVKY